MKVLSQVLFSLVFIVATGAAQAALLVFDSSGQQLPTLAPMLKEVNPAVVNISTFTTQQVNNPLMNDPFFRRFFNIPDQQRQRPQRRQNSAGSGVIIDKAKGIVVTNYHQRSIFRNIFLFSIPPVIISYN